MPASADYESFYWSGFYVSIHGGYLNSDISTKLDSVNGPLFEADAANGASPGSVSSRSGAALLGLQAGYDRQFGSFVLGVERDIAWANADGSVEFRAIDPGTPFAPIFAGQETVTS